MSNIGKPIKEVEFEPIETPCIPYPEPAPESVPVAEPEPEKELEPA